MDWSKKEISYQFIHMFCAFWGSYIYYRLIGYIMSSIIDVLNRFRDLCFWALGGLLILIVI